MNQCDIKMRTHVSTRMVWLYGMQKHKYLFTPVAPYSMCSSELLILDTKYFLINILIKYPVQLKKVLETLSIGCHYVTIVLFINSREETCGS